MRNGPLPVWVSIATLAGAVSIAPAQTPVVRGSAGASLPSVKPQPARGVSVFESYLDGDYEQVVAGCRAVFPAVRKLIERGETEIPVEIDGRRIITILDVSKRQREGLLAGGILNQAKQSLHRNP